MSRNRRRVSAAALACLLAALTMAVAGRAGAVEAITVAVLDFDTSGAPALGPDGGAMMGELLAAALSSRDGIHLIERKALKQAMEEQALGLSGMVDHGTAAQVRRLLGGQVLVTGRVFAVSNRLVVTARAIGTETGHLEAVVAEGRQGDNLRALIDGLAEKIGHVLSERGEAFAPGRKEAPDRVADLVRGLAGMTLPRVAVRVRETVLNVEEQDSVAASELTSLLLAANIAVRRTAETELPVDLDEYLFKPQALAGVDVVVFGKAVGQFGLRTGDLVSAKAQVKLTAVDTRTRRVLAVSEVEGKEIDVVAREAAIQAITSAAREGAREFVLKLVRVWNQKPQGSDVGLGTPLRDDR